LHGVGRRKGEAHAPKPRSRAAHVSHGRRFRASRAAATPGPFSWRGRKRAARKTRPRPHLLPLVTPLSPSCPGDRGLCVPASRQVCPCHSAGSSIRYPATAVCASSSHQSLTGRRIQRRLLPYRVLCENGTAHVTDSRPVPAGGECFNSSRQSRRRSVGARRRPSRQLHCVKNADGKQRCVGALRRHLLLVSQAHVGTLVLQLVAAPGSPSIGWRVRRADAHADSILPIRRCLVIRRAGFVKPASPLPETPAINASNSGGDRSRRCGQAFDQQRRDGQLPPIRFCLAQVATEDRVLASERLRIASRSFPESPCPCRSFGLCRHCWRPCMPIGPCRHSLLSSEPWIHRRHRCL
jgi:hypothetical protein